MIKNKKLYVNMLKLSSSFVIFPQSESLFYYDQSEDSIIEIEFQLDQDNKEVKGLIFKESGRQEIPLKKVTV